MRNFCFIGTTQDVRAAPRSALFCKLSAFPSVELAARARRSVFATLYHAVVFTVQAVVDIQRHSAVGFCFKLATKILPVIVSHFDLCCVVLRLSETWTVEVMASTTVSPSFLACSGFMGVSLPIFFLV